MRNKNILLFIITFIIFIVITRHELPSITSSNTIKNAYSSTSISNSKEISPSIRGFEVEKESLMKFKIASVTGNTKLKVELIWVDTGEKLLDLNDKNLTHAVFKKLKPGNYTLQITPTSEHRAYSYYMEVSSPKN